MIHAIRRQVIVQPDGRIEIYAPELKPGTHAEVIILEEPVQPPKHALRDLIGAGKGGFATPEEADAFIRQERDAWKQEEPAMKNAIRQTVRVKPGGVIEIRSPDLTPGALAEVIVLLEPSEVESVREARVRELAALFKATQALPQAQAISEDEIAAEIAEYRAAQR